VSLASLPVGPNNVWCVPLAREHVLAALVLAPLALHWGQYPKTHLADVSAWHCLWR